MPVDISTDFSKNPYKELIDVYNVSIYNQSDPFYTDRCFVYQINQTDIPLNTRRTEIYPNKTTKCGNGCKIEGVTSDNYIKCDCSNPTKCLSGDMVQIIENSIIDALDTSNFAIIKCDV